MNTAYAATMRDGIGMVWADEAAGVVTCDALEAQRCIDLVAMKPGYWAAEGPPLLP